MSSSSSPISSMKMVPPCACTNAPSRSRSAPVKAPRTWPNSSLSMSERDTPARSQMTNGASARGPAAWIASAHSSLPVPVSPSMSTATSDCATRSSTANTSRIFSEGPSSAPKRSDGDGRMGCERSAVASLSSVPPMVTTAPGPTVTSEKRAPPKKLPLVESEILDQHAGVGHLQLEVLARHRAVGEHQLAAGRLADEIGAALERELLALVRPRQHQQALPLGRGHLARRFSDVGARLFAAILVVDGHCIQA